MMAAIGPRLAAEAIGTGMLVAAVVGSGIMASGLTDDAGLALLCNAIATGAALVVLIGVLAPVSGAHLNPAVTLVLASRGDLPWREAGVYALAQLAGAIAGVALAHAMFGLPVFEAGATARTGANLWLAEIVATGGLIGVVLLGSTHRREAVPQLVGLYILAAYWFTASTSFANPAVTVARAMTATFTGIVPADAFAFIAAQLLAAGLCIAAMVALRRRA